LDSEVIRLLYRFHISAKKTLVRSIVQPDTLGEAIGGLDLYVKDTESDHHSMKQRIPPQGEARVSTSLSTLASVAGCPYEHE